MEDEATEEGGSAFAAGDDETTCVCYQFSLGHFVFVVVARDGSAIRSQCCEGNINIGLNRLTR